MPAKKKTKSEPSALCEKCSTPLTPTEVRAYREGLYSIDPHGDKRKWCLKCKEKSAQ